MEDTRSWSKRRRRVGKNMEEKKKLSALYPAISSEKEF